jgi:hypothetical protein
MSLLGLYNWDNTILDELIVPDGVDRSAVINNLLRECAELEILYPHPEALKFFVNEWSKERLPVWKRLEATLHYEYDPISNYDRKEEWEDQSNGESEAMTAGYNSSGSDVPESKSRASGKAIRKGRSYGNIGVTTTQQMIEQERRISEFDIYHIIINEFKKTFCLLIY